MSDRFVEPLPSDPGLAPLSLSTQWRARLLALADPLSIAAWFACLLSHSWMRWGDPLIDFPRDLYIAWRVSEGDLLYQRISNWYGPLANLVEGAGFRIGAR